MIDYTTYTYSKSEFLYYSFAALMITSAVGYVFYRSIVAVIIFSPCSIYLLKIQKKRLVEKRLNELNLQFKEAILSLSAALASGYSMENALTEAIRDLKLMYPEDAYIIVEFKNIIRQIRMSIPVEQAFEEFSVRTNLEDIRNFAEVLVTAKRTGGDIIKIIDVTCKNIGDKIEIRREVQTLITSKRMEVTIMSFIPTGMILYMWLTSPGYLDPLYHNLIGVLLMTAILVIYGFTILLAVRIMRIEV